MRKQAPLIDERILDDIPEALIRPLLAISIRASHPHTIRSYQTLLADIRKLAEACHAAGGESLYYVRVESMIYQRLHAMRAAQKWLKHPDAAATSIEPDRWSVEVHSQGRNHTLLVTYERAGVDPRTLEERVRLVVTEIPPRDQHETI